jgi:hypothetical protein
MNTHLDELTPNQRRLLPLLLTMTAEKACKAAGIARSTLHGWQQQQRFVDALAEARAELFQSAMSDLKGCLSKAVAKIMRLMARGKREDIQLRAAALIVEHGLKIKQLEEIEKRLALLESAIGR